jgi:4-amino-4-deoxy-L-arabinose transferase-like glycosyltransferase
MKKYLLIFSILILAFIVRFYNFSNRVVYGPEQGISLISAANNLIKPSLLGIPYLLRQTGNGLNLFTSPFFGYTLIPFILIFNFDPIKITSIFAIINVLIGILIFFVSKKIFGKEVSIFSTIVFLFNSRMIYHSMFIWTSNYMPLIGILTIYCLSKLLKEKKNSVWLILLGLLSGIGFGIQYFYLLMIIPIFIYIFIISKNKFKTILFFIIGTLIGELPTVIFDLKHNFYHLKTLFIYFADTLKNTSQSQISYYHFLALWPLFAIFTGYILWLIYKRNRILSILILFLYLIININSKLVSFTKPVGMPNGLKAKDIIMSAKIINDIQKVNFNVSVLGNFDNRGYVLRYLLENQFHTKVDPPEKYTDTGQLFVLALKSYNFNDPDIWELRTFKPYNVNLIKEIGDGWGLYELSK